MKSVIWMLAGAGAAMAAYFIFNQPGPQYATGNDDVEDAARRSALWGSKQRIGGTGRGVIGKVKQRVGEVTQNDSLAGEGIVDQAAGAVKEAAGNVAQSVGETIHELNR